MEWDSVYDRYNFAVMQSLIRENLSGAEVRLHREDLIERLDHVLGELYRGLRRFKKQRPNLGYIQNYKEIRNAKREYTELRALLEVGRETT